MLPEYPTLDEGEELPDIEEVEADNGVLKLNDEVITELEPAEDMPVWLIVLAVD